MNYQQAIQTGSQHHLAKLIEPEMLIQAVAEVAADLADGNDRGIAMRTRMQEI